MALGCEGTGVRRGCAAKGAGCDGAGWCGTALDGTTGRNRAQKGVSPPCKPCESGRATCALWESGADLHRGGPRYQAKVDKINALEPEFQALSDEELAAKTQEFRERYAAGESLDDLLPEAFAAVREASVRTIGLRHFDVQLIGGMALNEGQIAEMKTGEGKTLVSTLAGYLNAIPGHNVHIVTVNDYLARRDCEWMGQIYRFLGMKTGLIQNGMPPAAKKPA